MKKIFIILAVFFLIILGLGIYKFNFINKNIYLENGEQAKSHDGTYTIAGQKITLVNGISEILAAPGSASKIITKYFGNDIKHDLDEDGREDKVFILTQDTGGSGTFYYVVALLDTINGPIGTEGFLLGDRIAPQTINIDEGKTIKGTNRKNVIVVNYADRKEGESFDVLPSVGKSLWLKLDPATMQFGEVMHNFGDEKSIIGTYVAHLSKDVYTLKILSQAGEVFKGELDIKNFEKDSSTGTLVGTFKNGILLAEYTFQSEGIKSVGWVAFKKVDDGFIRGFGDVDPEIKIQSIDLSKITFDASVLYKFSDMIVSSVVFDCALNKNIKAIFLKDKVELALSDGRDISLPQVISASGARYANKDESFVFWNKGDTAFIVEGGLNTFKDCSIVPKVIKKTPLNEKTSNPISINPSPLPIFCTMDVKQCLDGSFVGRTGPKCEFVCP